MFTLDKSQEDRIDKWASKHSCKFRNGPTGAIGGQYTYMFTPTSIGMVTKCHCVCGDVVDVSDYEDW